jgi:VWFA-related protein
MKFPTLIVVSLVVFLLGSVPRQYGQALSAQSASPPAVAAEDSTQPPVFRSRSELVLVPVVVLKRGQRVSGLTKADFRVEQNGVEQSIASVEEVRPQGTAASIAMPTDGSYSNLPLDPAGQPRVTILVLDLVNTTQFQRTDAKEELVRFLSGDLQREDPISLLCITQNGLRSILPFTSDRKRLVQALQKLDTGAYWLHERQDAVRETLEQLQQIARGYAGVPGRKSLIFMAGNIQYPDMYTDDGHAVDGHAVPNEKARPLIYADPARYSNPDVIRQDFEETRNALLTSNVAVYPVELLGYAPFRQPALAAGLLYLAEGTGGSVCGESTNYSGCLNEAMEDSRSYYMLSYLLKSDDRKPGWRNLKVKLVGADATVRARSGFYYEDHSITSSADSNHKKVITALASPLDATGVLMNVRLLSLDVGPEGKKTAQFVITVPFQGIDVGAGGGAFAVDLDAGGIALDKNMKEAGEFIRPLKGNPRPEGLKQLAREGIRLRASFALPSGIYDMRFYVRNNVTGNIGTVVFPLEVR